MLSGPCVPKGNVRAPTGVDVLRDLQEGAEVEALAPRHLDVRVMDPLDHASFVELDHGVCPARDTHACSELAVAPEASDRSRERLRVTRLHEQARAAVLDDLATPTNVRCHDGHGHRLRLHRSTGKSLPMGRQNEEIERRVDVLDVKTVTDEDDAPLPRSTDRRLAQSVTFCVVLAARNDQQISATVERSESVEQLVEPLLGDEPAHRAD